MKTLELVQSNITIQYFYTEHDLNYKDHLLLTVIYFSHTRQEDNSKQTCSIRLNLSVFEINLNIVVAMFPTTVILNIIYYYV